jgi:hypothetical protein
MGDDQAALLRLWQEKRGELEPQDLSAWPPSPSTGTGTRSRLGTR